MIDTTASAREPSQDALGRENKEHKRMLARLEEHRVVDQQTISDLQRRLNSATLAMHAMNQCVQTGSETGDEEMERCLHAARITSSAIQSVFVAEVRVCTEQTGMLFFRAVYYLPVIVSSDGYSTFCV